MTSVEVDWQGFDALRQRLGTAGAMRYLQQTGLGGGDYGAERDAIFEGVSLDDMVRDAREAEQRWRNT